MTRSLAARAALALLAAGYLCGLLVTGDLIFRYQLGLPGGSGSVLARTAQYWTAAPGRPIPTGAPPVAVLSIEPLSVQASVAARVVAGVPPRLAAKAPAGDLPAATAAVSQASAGATGCEHKGSCRQEGRKPAR